MDQILAGNHKSCSYLHRESIHSRVSERWCRISSIHSMSRAKRSQPLKGEERSCTRGSYDVGVSPVIALEEKQRRVIAGILLTSGRNPGQWPGLFAWQLLGASSLCSSPMADPFISNSTFSFLGFLMIPNFTKNGQSATGA